MSERSGALALVGIALWAAPAAAEDDAPFDRTLDVSFGAGCGMFTPGGLTLRHARLPTLHASLGLPIPLSHR